MDIQELLRNISERLANSATVRNVYGDPVTVGGRTVIPAARVRYGFGGGGGRKAAEDNAGGGGGGGVVAKPCGAIEITAEGTRFVPFVDYQPMLIAAAAGFLLGAAFGALASAKRVEIVKRPERSRG
jgi:uncharacterized spore protein YtfJ